ncbi:MAG: HAMP domain-containing protein, partial [Candidatus Electrothrix sp. ATG2]|nr:HAMP domain-containing protein [Candidatus Electrothrix sp. ATG2]
MLGQVFQTALETGKSALSDYGYHDSGDGTLSLFLARALEDDETGQKIGALIFELSNTQVDRYMQARVGLGESGETYLVGTDSLIRSNLRFFKGSAILQTRIETELLKRWREEHDAWHHMHDRVAEENLQSHGSTEEMIYDNYQGVPVLGIYSALDFLNKWNVHWVLVAEIGAQDAFASATALRNIVVSLSFAIAVLVLLLSWVITVRLVSPLRQLTRWSEQVAAGDLSILDISVPANEIGQLNSSFRKTVISLRQAAEENQRYNWLQAGQLELDDQLRGDPSLGTLSKNIMNYLASYLGAQVGTLYIKEKDLLRLRASYAYTTRKNIADRFAVGEGMVGQAALEKKIIIISNVPDDYIQVTSGLGEKQPHNILLVPFMYNEGVKAVLELGSFTAFTELQVSFLEGISEKLAVAINGAQARNQLQAALTMTTEQAQRLQTSEEELRANQEQLIATNEELEEQAQRLRASEEELQANQDQLIATNEQLEEKNESLNQQKKKIEQANENLKRSRMEIERKAEEVAKASKYKSEFLANMSHELRTPLNSLLLLAQTLEENRKGNLTEDDVESLGIIRKSGKELLYLINDILDLSKIEAGRMMLVREDISIAELLTDLKSRFQHVAEKKGLALHFLQSEEAPEVIRSDRKRLDQILKNLLSNALKFTEQGAVTVSVSLGPASTG